MHEWAVIEQMDGYTSGCCSNWMNGWMNTELDVCMIRWAYTWILYQMDVKKWTYKGVYKWML